MDNRITIAVICGTKREGRQSIKAAEWIAAIGRQQPDVEVLFVDPNDFTLPPDGAPDDGRDPKYSDITARADGFFIITPEYNHSFPGSLKRLLDSEDENYCRKAAALAGVSSGQWGGTRAVESLLPPLRTLGLAVVRPTTYFPRVQDIFDEQGVMHLDQVEMYTKSAVGTWTELLWLARALKAGRTAG